MTQDEIRQWLFAVLAILVLIAFVWLFASELWSAFSSKPKLFTATDAAQDVADPRTYVTTAVAALVGGVAAVFLGVQGAKTNVAIEAWNYSDYIRIAYVVVYVVFGGAAIIAWVRGGGGTSLPIKNLAVTFIGLVTPAVAAYLGSQ